MEGCNGKFTNFMQHGIGETKSRRFLLLHIAESQIALGQ
jgi:hypothetical protein